MINETIGKLLKSLTRELTRSLTNGRAKQQESKLASTKKKTCSQIVQIFAPNRRASQGSRQCPHGNSMSTLFQEDRRLC